MQEKNKLILIDADFILWKTVPNKVLSETEFMYGIKSKKSLEETLNLIDEYLKEKILIPTKATHYIAFLGGNKNFRKFLAEDYKQGRSSEKPKYFNLAKEYLIEKYNFIKINNAEAEDYVNYFHNKFITEPNNHIFGKEILIVREDHDLNQIAGKHYNPTKKEFSIITKEQANYFFWDSMISGCSSDHIKGIPGKGHAYVKKLFKDREPLDYIFHTLNAYMDEYGEENGIYKFQQTYRLLKLLSTNEDQCRKYQHRGTADATSVSVYKNRGYQRRDGKIAHNLIQAIDQVIDQLGKAHHVNINIIRIIFLDYCFKILTKLAVIQRFTGLWIDIQQRQFNQRRLHIRGNIAANNTGPADILPQVFHPGWIPFPLGCHRPAFEAQLGHFGPAQTGGPETTHVALINTRQEIERVVDLLQMLLIFLGKNVALFVFDHHADGVPHAAHRFLVGKIILDIGMGLRNHVIETGIDRQLECRRAQEHR